MKTNKYITALTFLLLVPFTAHADLLSRGFSAEFDLYVSGIYAGVNKRTVKNTNNKLIIHSSAEPKGLAKAFFSDVINETSSLKFVDGQLKPISYHYKQTGGKDLVDTTVTFDQENKQIHISKDDQHFPLTDNSFDVVSFQFALMQQLKQGKKTFKFDVATHRRMNYYTATIKSMKEEVETEYGSFDAVLIESIDRTGERKFLLWCVPELDYLPVQVKHERKGKSSSLMELKSLTRS